MGLKQIINSSSGILWFFGVPESQILGLSSDTVIHAAFKYCLHNISEITPLWQDVLVSLLCVLG